VVRFGCGNAYSRIFDLQEGLGYDVLVLVLLKNLESGHTQRFYLPSYDGKYIRVGFGMCSGEFWVNPKDDYKLTFNFIDAYQVNKSTKSFKLKSRGTG